MNSRRIFFINRSFTFVALHFLVFAFFSLNIAASNPLSQGQATKYKSLQKAANSSIAFDSKKQKLDASTQILIQAFNKGRANLMNKKSNLSIYKDTYGRLMVDLFIQFNNQPAQSALLALGVDTRTQVGDILIARAPIEALSALADVPGVRRVEMSKKRQIKLDSSHVSIGADLIHQGIELPQAFKGEGVVVGVIDSGIDFTHPDFSDENGSRIQYLLEFTEGGGQNEWTKNDIDNNAGSITQRDGNGGGGHGTHVAGIAAGGGQLNSAMIGVAPASDIIFVKAIRDPDSDGGFVDTDVIAGCQYIFDKADEMGKPAVINLSLGSHFGPHDGSSLYEQALSGLVSPGKLIVAAAGNEGDDFIHAGGISTAGIFNETIVIADSSNQNAVISMWYEAGVVDEVSVFAYDLQLNFLSQLSSIPVGFSTNEPSVFVIDNDTLGFVSVDALTTQDPNNGDGNVLFVIENNDIPTIDISNTIWAVASQGSADGRVDLWVAAGGSFYDQVVGFQGETEMPGNNDFSVGTPATAEKVISVGSYTTKNGWTDVEGDVLTLNPAPAIGDKAPSSSFGPTRDGRLSPDITAPGLFIFSAFSSHLTEGIGYSPAFVLQGGEFLGQGGTSQASPHVAGTIALMLQVSSDLSYEETIQVLTETSRTNQFTGTVPNNNIGPGYLDAHAAVKKVVDLVSSVENASNTLPESFVLKQNYPNPFNPSTNIEYALAKDTQVILRIYNVAGQQIKTLVNETQKVGSYTIQWDGTNSTGRHAASGIYYARFIAGPLAQTRKMVLMR